MTRHEFNKLLATVTTKTATRSPKGSRRAKLDLAKVAAMPQEDAEKLVRFLLRQHNRAPIVLELWQRSGIPRETLGAFGYFYLVKGAHYTFWCTQENRSMVRTPELKRLQEERRPGQLALL